ncbi:hypothetical protein ACFY20_08855 [Streptomyces sp. NPDC001312]|uniref:hypothetical protein n=1 Tax=Streptomyces sp. NPDC001312 TaxID=3364561 RepID=UPI00367C716F
MPNTIPEVTARPLATAGREQLLVDCPHCASVHRHLADGARRAPCGGRYSVVPNAPKEPAP